MRSSARAIVNTMIFALMLFGLEMMFFTSTVFAIDLPQRTWVIDKTVIIEDFNELESKSIEAFQWNNITYVPARALSNQFEINIDYMPTSSEIILNSGKAELRFLLNNASALILNTQGAKAVAANSYCLGGVSYIPLRFAAENLNLNVIYNAQNGMIEISGAIDHIKEKFVYSLDEDLSKIIYALDEYKNASVVELKSNNNPQQLVTLQREGMNITMDILEGERQYQVVIKNQWNSTTGNIQSAQNINEIKNGKSTPMRLLGGEAFFNIGDIGIDQYQCYSISDMTKERIENSGCKYNINKIGDTERNISIFVNESGRICRYIIYGSDDNVISDFTVKILE